MKVVIDTNVVISGLFYGGIPKKVLEMVMEEKYQVILSEPVIDEYKMVANRIFSRFPNNDAYEFLNALITRSTIIDAMDIITPRCGDPDNKNFYK
jgi:putative PIN family toxin of toxin-antitoxin system